MRVHTTDVDEMISLYTEDNPSQGSCALAFVKLTPAMVAFIRNFDMFMYAELVEWSSYQQQHTVNNWEAILQTLMSGNSLGGANGKEMHQEKDISNS